MQTYLILDRYICFKKNKDIKCLVVENIADLLQSSGADVELLHRSRLHRPANERVALVTTQVAMLEDQRVLFLFRKRVPLK